MRYKIALFNPAPRLLSLDARFDSAPALHTEHCENAVSETAIAVINAKKKINRLADFMQQK